MEGSSTITETIELPRVNTNQHLVLRSYGTSHTQHNVGDRLNMVQQVRQSRIQWSEGTLINSCMGRRKVNCCGVYPDIWTEARLHARSSSSSSSSSSSDDGRESSSMALPSAYRCSRDCCGHPLVTYPIAASPMVHSSTSGGSGQTVRIVPALPTERSNSSASLTPDEEEISAVLEETLKKCSTED